jgi:peptidyl-prolyl cis-trans isomerase D
VTYLVLDAEALAGDTQDVDEDELRAAYDARIDEFIEPEQRNLRHILLQVAGDADTAAADAIKAELAALRDQIEAGANFAEVAREHSDDPGSAANGGDLGLVPRGIMDPAFEQAAFELEQGVVSEPVRSRFGYHLIEVTGIEGGEPAPFEDVREQLVTEMTSGEAEAAYFEFAEQLANLTYESPDSLIPAAETLGLEIQTSDWITRDGGEGLLAQRRVIDAAFSDDVLTQGNNSELLEPDRDRMQAIVLRVDEHEPAAAKPLEEVREEIVTALAEQTASEAALAAAEAMVAELKAGAELASVAADYEVEEPGSVSRNAPNVPPTPLELAFQAPRPAEGQISYASGPMPNGSAVVVAVSGVEDADADALEASAKDAERRRLSQTLGRHGYDAVLDDLVARAKVERRQLPSSNEP